MKYWNLKIFIIFLMTGGFSLGNLFGSNADSDFFVVNVDDFSFNKYSSTEHFTVSLDSTSNDSLNHNGIALPDSSLNRDTIADNNYFRSGDTLFFSEIITSFKKDSLIDVWYKYLGMMSDDVDEHVHSEQETNGNSRLDSMLSIGMVVVPPNLAHDSVSEVADENTAVISDIDSSVREVSDRINKSSAANKYNFYVQIAASRVLLDSSEVRKIYNGSENVIHRFEEGWHKYQAGMTNNHIEAFKLLNTIQVEGDFVVVYNEEGNKTSLWKAILDQRRNMIAYRVQVAASKIRLSEERLAKIYPGNYEIIEIEEEGWYKYQIAAGSKYKKAREKEKIINVSGSFVAAYLNGKKIQLYRAFKLFDI